jgi:tetratricopeptide (TPR) repeat protein
MFEDNTEDDDITIISNDLTTLKQLIYKYQIIGHHNKLEILLCKCYKMECESLGQSNIETLKTMELLGNYYLQKKLYSNACLYYETCVQLRLEQFGYNNIDTLNIMDSLAEAYYKMRSYDLGINLLVRCVQYKREVLVGSDNNSTISSLTKLGDCYYSLGEYTVSQGLYEECYDRIYAINGKEDYLTVNIMRKLSCVYECLQHPIQAKCLLEDIVHIHRSNIADGSCEITSDHIETLVELCRLYILCGTITSHKDTFIYTYSACIDYYGDDNAMTIRSTSYLATYYYSITQYDSALPLFLNCFEKTTVLFGEMHSITLTSLYNLGKLYSLIG